MNKSIIRKRTKMLAKGIAMQSILRLVFVIAIQYITTMLLSNLVTQLAFRYFPEAFVRFGPYLLHYVGVPLIIASNLLLIPIELGVTEYVLKLVRKQPARIADIFNWYSDGDKLRAGLSYFWFMTVLSVVTVPLVQLPLDYLAGALSDVQTELLRQAAEGVTEMVITPGIIDGNMILLSVGLVIIGFMVEVRFMAAAFIIADDPKKSGFAAGLQSWKFMRGHTWEYIVLILSFALWFLACFVTMFLIAIFFIPYFTVTQAIFAEYIRSDTGLADAKKPDIESDVIENDR